MSETRLVDIETKLAYQEDAVDELTKAVSRQEKRIAQLEATCKLLIERIGEMAARADSGQPAHEIPPHY